MYFERKMSTQRQLEMSAAGNQSLFWLQQVMQLIVQQPSPNPLFAWIKSVNEM